MDLNKNSIFQESLYQCVSLQKSFRKAAEEVQSANIPIVLLLTKTDLLGDSLALARQRYAPHKY